MSDWISLKANHRWDFQLNWCRDIWNFSHEMVFRIADWFFSYSSFKAGSFGNVVLFSVILLFESSKSCRFSRLLKTIRSKLCRRLWSNSSQTKDSVLENMSFGSSRIWLCCKNLNDNWRSSGNIYLRNICNQSTYNFRKHFMLDKSIDGMNDMLL